MNSRKFALSGAAAVALLTSGAASAQVETVVVTAKTLPFDQVADLGKTGTPLADLPRSIEVVPAALFNAQGATQLSQVLPDVSGVSQGGQYNFGFFDRFIIRGLNATFLDDGLPEGTSDLTGFVHSLLGVERVEILKGPGSAMFGSAEEGGTINLVHYRPTDAFGALLSEQFGSYGTTTTDVSLNGPTGIDGLNGRLDGEYQHADGFRDLADQVGAVTASLGYRLGRHDFELRLEYDNLENLPDAAGIPFGSNGRPIDVPTKFKYYTPFAFADQQIERVFLSDAWSVDDDLVVNLRMAYGARNVDLARNSGGSVSGIALVSRQLREQKDNVDDLTFQAEPTWTFATGGIKHVLLAGFEGREINAGTVRATANLPGIADIYAPVVNDGSLASLNFQCGAKNSCDNAKLLGEFYGLYAVDQIDVTDALKVRLSVRQDWFDTEAQARTAGIPANPGQEEPCVPPKAGSECALVPGAPAKRSDSKTSWDEGLVYFFTPDLSVFGGFSSAAYPIFNTEEPESVGHTPETGTQYEAGLRFQQPWLTASTSVYRATRDNVFEVFAGPGGLDVPTVFSYRVEGVEADVNVRPLEDWSILANFAAQTPVITDYPATPPAVSDVGNPVPSVPSILANLWTSYDIPVPFLDEKPEISFGERYRNHEFGALTNTRLLPGVALSDVALSLPLQAWNFQAGVSNLFNKANFVDAAGTGGGAMPGPDRTYFVKLTYKPG